MARRRDEAMPRTSTALRPAPWPPCRQRPSDHVNPRLDGDHDVVGLDHLEHPEPLESQKRSASSAPLLIVTGLVSSCRQTATRMVEFLAR